MIAIARWYGGIKNNNKTLNDCTVYYATPSIIYNIKGEKVRHYYIINGKEDKELTSVGLWFAITFIYSCNIDNKEVRFKNAKDYEKRARIITKCNLDRIKTWINYARYELNKNTKNVGNVTLIENKNMACKLIILLNKGVKLRY